MLIDSDAGRNLARALEHLKGANAVVLALPRGGEPVGFEVAEHLRAPLDLLLVRKISAPGHEERASGAIVDGLHPQVVVNQEVVDMIRPPRGYFEAAEKRELAEIERSRRLYLGAAQPIDVKGRVTIVVDVRIATGANTKAAPRGVGRNKPSRLVLAAPVGPPSIVGELDAECDEVAFLATPDPFTRSAFIISTSGRRATRRSSGCSRRRESFMLAPAKAGQAARDKYRLAAIPYFHHGYDAVYSGGRQPHCVVVMDMAEPMLNGKRSTEALRIVGAAVADAHHLPLLEASSAA